MQKKIYNVETIGCGLAVLYAISCSAFIHYLNIPESKLQIAVYVVLFVTLFIGAVAAATLKEWGRKLLIAMNTVMLICLTARFIPKVDLAPLSYLFLNVIVLLYFSQGKVKSQFHRGKYGVWKRSILVVDDDEVIIQTVRPVLLSHGYSVLTALTGEEGLQIAAGQRPDLILLDVILPGIKGREVCKKLKENPVTRGIPVVFLTAKDSPDDIQAEMDAGAAGHLTKPVDAKTLIETIQKKLGPGGSNIR